MENTAVIVLAAGKGERMGSETPKPLIELNGKPFIAHLLNSIEKIVKKDNLYIVIGNDSVLIREALGPGYTYIVQTKQLGTGHAVRVCKEKLQGTADKVIVLYADHPFVTSDTIKALAALQTSTDAVISMATTTVPDFEGWRLPFYSYGRVLRDESDNVSRIVERKDATEDELAILEVSPSFFCYKAKWLWENLELLQNHNAQSEYYLTDLIEIASHQKLPITSVNVDPHVAIGINTKDELELAKTFIRNGEE